MEFKIEITVESEEEIEGIEAFVSGNSLEEVVEGIKTALDIV